MQERIRKMKKSIKNLIKTAFIILFVALSGCNTGPKYIYDVEKVEPTYAKKVDLCASYGSEWTIIVYEKFAKEDDSGKYSIRDGVFGQFSPTKFRFDDNISDYFIDAYLIYYEDMYFSISFVFGDNQDKQKISTYEFYGPIYSYVIAGTGFYNGSEKVVDNININCHKLSFNAFNDRYDWTFKLVEYKKDKNIIQGCLNTSGYNIYMPLTHNWFYLRRVVKDRYFAINFKSVDSDDKTILEYYNTNHCYVLYYYTFVQI